MNSILGVSNTSEWQNIKTKNLYLHASELSVIAQDIISVATLYLMF
jgi:hypothetical protein